MEQQAPQDAQTQQQPESHPQSQPPQQEQQLQAPPQQSQEQQEQSQEPQEQQQPPVQQAPQQIQQQQPQRLGLQHQQHRQQLPGAGASSQLAPGGRPGLRGLRGRTTVVFTEDKLGLTLKSQEQVDPSGYRIPVTIVKSTIFSVGQVSHQIREGDVLQSVNGESIRNLEFPDVLRILKIAPRPIRLRFRTRFTLRGSFPRRAWSMSGDEQQEASSRRSSTGSADSELRMPIAAGPFAFPGLEEDGDDSDSQNAVMSESFGDADSARSTENSSVIADCTDTEFKSGRQSRLAAFLRKPFRRGDGFDGGRWELRMGIVPASPRAEIVLASPSKAAILVRWRANTNAVSYHLQFSRDWTMKVWKSWSGRPQRSSDNEHELVTSIFGLDYSKSYVVRVRYEFSGGNGPSEWSSPSAPISTTSSVDAMHHRIAPPRAQRG